MRRLTGRSGTYACGPASSSLVVGAAMIAIAACAAPDSTTDLNPEGPPMVRQVFVSEKIIVGEDTERIRTGLAFGSHADTSLDEDDGEVLAAVARGSTQQIRIVLDELLVGNAVEEVACNGVLLDGSSFSKVPLGATPDDVAACSGAPAELGRCEDICIGPEGPVGILDVDLDGAADDTRMIDYGRKSDVPEGTGELAVNVECAGAIMPLDPQLSFFNPSGNQQVPAGPIGLNGLGPAIVLVPVVPLGLRTGSACTITFRPEVTDKDGNRVCAPPGGSIDEDCPGDGNTELITFSVEALKLKPNSSDPADGAVGVPAGVAPSTIQLQFIAAIDPATLSAITLSDGVADVPITATLRADDAATVLIEVPGGYAVDTDYVLTISTALTDHFGGPLPQTETLSFTTRAAI
jgi:hypothetical protein